MKARNQLKAWMEEQGVRQADLARELGVSEIKVMRLLRGQGSLSDKQFATLGKLVGGPLAKRLKAEAPKHRDRRHSTRPDPAPEPGAAAPATAATTDIAGRLAADAALVEGKDQVEALAGAAILGGLTRLSVSARAEGTRLKALEVLASYKFGKPVQRILDTTPKAPAEAPELLDALRLLQGKVKSRAQASQPEPADTPLRRLP